MANIGVDFAENGWPFAPERIFQAVEYARGHGLTREWHDTHPAGIGLTLRVGPARASFYMRARVDGRMVATKLGAADGPGRLSVDDARRALQRGKFSPAEKAIRRGHSTTSPAGCGLTIAEAWGAYIAAAEAGTFSMRRRQRKPLAAKTVRGYRSIYCAHMLAHGDQPLEWLAEHAGEMFERLGAGGHGALANQFLAVAKAMFEHCRRGGVWQGANPIADPDRFEKFSVRERSVNLTDRQMAQLLAAISQEGAPYNDLFMLATFTGQRIGNCQTLRWNQIDIDRGIIRFRAEDRKNATADAIPIAAEVVAMLRRRMEARPEDDGGFVFVSPRKPGAPVSNYGPAWARVKSKAGLDGVEDLCVHGLRHNFGSWGQESSAPDSSITAAVGHTSSKSTERYKHGRSIVVARPAVEAIAGRLVTILDAAKKTKVPASRVKKSKAT